MPIVTSEFPLVQQKLIRFYTRQREINKAIHEHPNSELMKELKEEVDKEVKAVEQEWAREQEMNQKDRCFVFR